MNSFCTEIKPLGSDGDAGEDGGKGRDGVYLPAPSRSENACQKVRLQLFF